MKFSENRGIFLLPLLVLVLTDLYIKSTGEKITKTSVCSSVANYFYSTCALITLYRPVSIPASDYFVGKAII